MIVKLTPMATSIASIAKAAEASGADGLSLVNTYVGMAIDIESRRPRIATVTGGYSGPPIKPLALARVWEAFKAVRIPLIGMGGIASAEDVVEFYLAGASAVEIGTMLYVDPALPATITKRLQEYCDRHGVTNLSDLTGQMKWVDPAKAGGCR